MNSRIVAALLLMGVLVSCAQAQSGSDSEAKVTPAEAVESASRPTPPSTLPDGRRGPSATELEHYEFMIECLADRGIPAEYDPETGGLQIGLGLDQQDALNEALEACREADGQPTGVVTEDYLRQYYPFLVQLYACLVAEDLPVPELTSEESFVDGGGEWHPYQVMWAATEASATGTSQDLSNAETLCPNDPDDPQW